MVFRSVKLWWIGCLPSCFLKTNGQQPMYDKKNVHLHAINP